MNSSAGAGNYRRGSTKVEKVMYILNLIFPLLAHIHPGFLFFIISLKIHRPQLAQWCWSTFEGALMREKTILFPLLVNSSFSGKRRRSESCYVLLRCRGVAVFWVIILNLTLGTLSAQIQSFLSVSKLACLTLHTH